MQSCLERLPSNSQCHCIDKTVRGRNPMLWAVFLVGVCAQESTSKFLSPIGHAAGKLCVMRASSKHGGTRRTMSARQLHQLMNGLFHSSHVELSAKVGTSRYPEVRLQFASPICRMPRPTFQVFTVNATVPRSKTRDGRHHSSEVSETRRAGNTAIFQ